MALQNAVQEAAWSENVPLAATVGIASGSVYSDSSAGASPDWLVKGSEIDVAVRLSRFCPVGGIVLCPATVAGARQRVEIHHIAKLSARGGKRMPIHLLKSLRAPKNLDLTAPQVRPRMMPVDVPALLHD